MAGENHVRLQSNVQGPFDALLGAPSQRKAFFLIPEPGWAEH